MLRIYELKIKEDILMNSIEGLQNFLKHNPTKINF